MVTSWNNTVTSHRERLLMSVLFLAALVSLMYAPFIPSRGLAGGDWFLCSTTCAGAAAPATILEGLLRPLLLRVCAGLLHASGVEGAQFILLASWLLATVAVYGLLYHAAGNDRKISFFGAFAYAVLPPLAPHATSLRVCADNVGLALVAGTLIFFLRGAQTAHRNARRAWWAASAFTGLLAATASLPLFACVPAFIVAWSAVERAQGRAGRSFDTALHPSRVAVLSVVLAVTALTAWGVGMLLRTDGNAALPHVSATPAAAPQAGSVATVSASVLHAMLPWFFPTNASSSQPSSWLVTALCAGWLLLLAVGTLHAFFLLCGPELSYRKERTARLFVPGGVLTFTQLPFFFQQAGAKTPPALCAAMGLGSVLTLLAVFAFLLTHSRRIALPYASAVLLLVTSCAAQIAAQRETAREWITAQALCLDYLRLYPGVPSGCRVLLAVEPSGADVCWEDVACLLSDARVPVRAVASWSGEPMCVFVFDADALRFRPRGGDTAVDADAKEEHPRAVALRRLLSRTPFP